MSVPTVTSRSVYEGDGATVAFSTGFYFLAADDLAVKLTPVATGVETLLTLGVHYVVALPTPGSGASGTVTLVLAPANGDGLVIERDVHFVQATSFRASGNFSPSAHEDALDRIVFQTQELERRLGDIESAGAPGSVVAGDGLAFSGTTLHVSVGDGLLADANDVHVEFGGAGLMVPATRAAAAAGTSTAVARIDHKHDVAAGVPVAGAVVVGGVAAEGAAATLARSDHTHEVLTAAPVTVTKAANDAGVATSFSRSDHKHDVGTAAAATLTDSTNAEGSASTLARSDHTHSHGARGGGTLHAEATAAVAGFMPAADKARMDNITHVRAGRGTVLEVPILTPTVIPFTTEHLDTLGEFEPTTGIFTALHAGSYLVTALVGFDSAALTANRQCYLAIGHNGGVDVVGPKDYAEVAATRTVSVAISHVVRLAVSDTVRIWVTHDMAANLYTTSNIQYVALTIDRLI